MARTAHCAQNGAVKYLNQKTRCTSRTYDTHVSFLFVPHFKACMYYDFDDLLNQGKVAYLVYCLSRLKEWFLLILGIVQR